jgi:hypothetical protein
MQSESPYGKAPPEAGLLKQGEPIKKKDYQSLLII